MFVVFGGYGSKLELFSPLRGGGLCVGEDRIRSVWSVKYEGVSF